MYIEDVFREKLLAANAAGKYPETCRTRKSSLRALMVLYGVRTGEQTAASLDYVRWRGSSLIGLPLFYLYLRNINIKKNPPELLNAQEDFHSPLKIQHVLHIIRPRKFHRLFQHSKRRTPRTRYTPAISISSFKHSEKLVVFRMPLH